MKRKLKLSIIHDKTGEMSAPRFTEQQLADYSRRMKYAQISEVANPGAPKQSKHRNQITQHQSLLFHSKKEARLWDELLLREKAGEIRYLQRQVRFRFTCGGETVGWYACDFWYEEWEDLARDTDITLVGGVWRLVVADCKTKHTASLPGWYRTKKLMLACYGITVIEL